MSLRSPLADGARRAAGLVAVLCAAAVALVLVRSAAQLPPSGWIAAAWHPAPTDTAQLVFHFSTLPRLAMAALCGAALAVAGAIFQHVLRNPLASPVTLGVAGGAELALVAATLFAPTTLGQLPGVVALVGGALAMLAVLVIASAQSFSSLRLILSGLSVSLFCGALGHALKIMNQEYLASVFLWGAGSLAQDGWSGVASLAPRLLVCVALAGLILRPLHLLGLADESARGLGLSLAMYRAGALGVAVCLAATVTAAVGILGFVEIAAPLVTRLAGVRRLGPRLAVSAVVGAATLVIVDCLVQAGNDRFGATLPTGAATAFLGAPLLLWLLPRMRSNAGAALTLWNAGDGMTRKPVRTLAFLAGLAGLAIVLAIGTGRNGQGWSIVTHDALTTLVPWRVPRTLLAFGAGAMLAAAGALLQRATGNAMASPEVLGLGAAVMAGIAIALLLNPTAGVGVLLGAGALAALGLLAVLFWRGSRARFAPDQLLLTGIALSAALDAVVIAFLALNDARAGTLLGWMAGSTAAADGTSAVLVLLLAAVLVPGSLFFARSLDLLPLGEPIAGSLGVALGRTRLGIMLFAAALTAGAVLSVGPLTFVGLVGPHLTRRLGLHRSLTHIPAAALGGGLVMVLADWLGRVVIAPFELPAGLVASLIGIPYLVVQLRRRRAARAT